MPSGSLPGLRGTEHIGFTVPDLDQAVDFFCNVIGCTLIYRTGTFHAPGGIMTERLGVHEDARIEGMAMLRCANGSNYELFQYAAPDRNPVQPRNSDAGGFHLCLYVDDINMAASYLEERGLKMMGRPQYQTKGPFAGESYVYFLTPWGMQMELITFPNGKGYEKETEARLWSTT